MSEKSKLVARNARRSVIRMTSSAKAAHTGSSLSLIDMMSVLYVDVVKSQSENTEGDVVLVSKGHAAAGVYAVLAHSGKFSPLLLDTYCQNGSDLSGHVTKNTDLGIPFSTGSLGHALPFGLGKALSAKRSGLRTRIFVILSDGECDEGSNWEAALIAAHLNLNNVCVLIDRNRLQSLGGTEETVQLEPLGDKWAAFGWDVRNVNGHDHANLSDTLNLPWEDARRPLVLICETIKGFGVSFMENSIIWHYRPPSGEELELAKIELGGFE